jgi:CRISPR system Cascade subunit CasD
MTARECCVFLRLEGPMQSWGNHARGANGAHRTTHTRPTKSGVIGMVANAIGRDYSDGIGDLAALGFGVRADVPGRLEVDYHTAGAGTFPMLPGEAYRNRKWFRRMRSGHMVLGEDEYGAAANVTYDPNTASLVADAGNVVVTHDWYLADASFLAVLLGPAALVDGIAEALAKPRRPIYLGRRAFLPSRPILAGTADLSDPIVALAVPARASRTRPGPVPAWIEPSSHSGGVAAQAVPVSDQPVSFGGPTARAARLEVAAAVNPVEAATAGSNVRRDPPVDQFSTTHVTEGP